MHALRHTAAMILAGGLAACAQTGSGGGVSSSDGSSSATTAASAPALQPIPATGPEPTNRPDAAQAYIECGLRAYYSSPTPISARQAINLCEAYRERYIAVYFAEFGFRGSRARARRAITPRAVQELQALIDAA